MNEDALINKITVAQYIARLKSPETRLLLLLVYGIDCPKDWNPDERWPPTYAAVGDYIGRRFRGRPLSEATIRYREMCALEELNPNLRLTRKRRLQDERDARDDQGNHAADE